MPYRYTLWRSLRSPGVTERRNGPLGLRDDDDDEVADLGEGGRVRFAGGVQPSQ